MSEFASWWKTKTLSERVAKDWGQSSSPSLDSVRLPPPLQKRFSSFLETSPANKLCSRVIENKLFRCNETKCSFISSKSVRREELHKTNESRGTGLFLSGIHCSEKVRGLEASHRPVSVERSPNPSLFSDGHVKQGQGSVAARHVGNVNRPVRCVPSHPNAGRPPVLPLLSGGRHKVQVPGPAVRTDASTMAVYRSCKTAKEVGSQTLSNSVSVPRRLAERASVQGNTATVYTKASKSLCKIRTVSKRTQVRTNPSPGDSVPRREVRPTSGKGLPHSSKTGKCSTSASGNNVRALSSIVASRDRTRHVDSHVPYSAVGSATSQALPESSCTSGKARQESQSKGDRSYSSPKDVGILGAARGMAARYPVPLSPAGPHSVHGCVPDGVGGSLSGLLFQRHLGQTHSSHKLARAEDSSVRSSALTAQGEEPISSLSCRQHGSSSLRQQARRDQVYQTPTVSLRDRSVGTIVELYSQGTPHHGLIQCLGGSGIEGRSSSIHGMEAILPCVQLVDPAVSLGTPGVRIIRQQHEPPPTEVCVPVSGPPSLGSERVAVRSTEGDGAICLPPSSVVGGVPSSAQTGESLSPAVSGAMVPLCQVGASTTHPTSESKDTVSSDAVVASSTSLGVQLPQPKERKSDPTVVGEDQLRALGYSDAVIQRLALAHAASTKAQYKSKWTLFEAWAREKKPIAYDPTSPTLLMLTEFLTYLFQERQLSTGTISNYKSAIAYYWKRFFHYDIPMDDTILCDLMKGFQRERPLAKKKVIGWDLKLVLEFFRTGKFKSWKDLSNKELTLKTVFLLALASGKRRGELHALTRKGVKEMHGEEPGRLLYPSENFLSKTHLKTSGLGALKSVFIPQLRVEGEADDLLCPVKCLDMYLSRSDTYRSDSQAQLLIPWKEGIRKDVTPQSISNYLKSAIRLAYENVSNDDDLLASLQVVPHTVRHVATSLKALNHFSMNEVLSAGGWVSPNTFISHYLHDFSRDSMSGLCTLGGFIAAGSQC